MSERTGITAPFAEFEVRIGYIYGDFLVKVKPLQGSKDEGLRRKFIEQAIQRALDEAGREK